MTIQYGACALHAGYVRLQTHTQNMQYILLSTANMAKRTYLDAALYANCLSCPLSETGTRKVYCGGVITYCIPT
jgi:hypothetical protein